MKIGITKRDYPHQRNIVGIVDEHSYHRVYDLNQLLAIAEFINRRYLKMPVRLSVNPRGRFNDLGMGSVDLMHLFNAVSFASTPWVSTFETVIPRYQETLNCHLGVDCGYDNLRHNKQVIKALEAIAGHACKQLIALSVCNLNLQKEMLAHFPQFESAIAPKLIQIHPPQQPLVSTGSLDDMKVDDELRFLFVGSTFFRKGGREIISALSELRREDGIDIKLTIVSSMITDTHATCTNNDDVVHAMTEIEKNSAWIDYYKRLPNTEVLRLIRDAHVGLLPTYSESYGFIVLEYQASGCPVITTNVRALPEINNDHAGWLVDVPKNRLGVGLFSSDEERATLSAVIHSGLKQIVKEIAANRDSIHAKSVASLQRILDEHSPERYANKLAQIYSMVD
jgi:glycosyltransferase involved in cell wall biosynthesis